ncbi:uncharacterized protein [Triticum aestivum]|uniref:uncharacterized protein isoform X5 n=1 Tax=Triticum aestivum TaxID=4565 RepID=UPI001D026D35|nr:uncharacterized protein LOC123131546 isoform X5 [Triticum aestivum]
MMPASLPLPKQHGPLQLAGEQFVASMEKTSRENLEASLQKLLQHAERRVDSQLKDAEIKIVEVQKVTNGMVSFLLWVL